MSARSTSGERGITLAEIVVAVAVISVGLVGLAMVIPLSVFGVHEGNATSTATFLAMEKLEEIRNVAWTVSPSPDGTDCLGHGTSAAPTTTTCTRSLPTACTSGATCVTYPDEAPVAGQPGYDRTVRVYECTETVPPNGAAGCAGTTSADLRLVRVTVSSRPMSGVGGQGTSGTKSTAVDLIVTKRP